MAKVRKSKRKIKSFKGTMIYPTSTNSEDARIPPEGFYTKVRAKNLMFADEFLLRGGFVGKVTLLKYDNRKKTVEFTVTRPNGKNFTRTVDFYSWVRILETPESRADRRYLSRLSNKVRYAKIY